MALTISLSITVALSILLMLFAPYCFRIFTDEPLVIQYAIEIMGYFVPFYFLWTCIEILANSLRGSGDALVPMVISVGGHLRPADPVGLSGSAPLEHPHGHLHLLPRLLGGDGGRADPVLLPGEVEAVVTAPLPAGGLCHRSVVPLEPVQGRPCNVGSPPTPVGGSPTFFEESRGRTSGASP